MSSDTAGKPYWESAWANHQPEIYPGPIYDFHDLYRRYLPRDDRMTCVEIGAMPGNHLVYFHKEYAYRVTGIDYCSDVSPVAKTMALNGISDYSLVNADIFTLSDGTRYDVVFSTGFVEHFEDYRGVIALHAGMVKDGGYLLVTVPNTKYLHKLLMRTFCPAMLAIHRTYLMDRHVLRAIAESMGFETLHCDYLRTFRPFYPLPYPAAFVTRVVNKLLRLANLDRIPNRFASPYLYLVAKKRGPDGRTAKKT